MRRYSPPYNSPPRRGYGGRSRSPMRRGYGGRSRSPPRRGGGGGYGRHKEQNNGSLLVRNIPLDCRPEELRIPFERFGLVRDVYIPKDYYTGIHVCGKAPEQNFRMHKREPRGFAFVQFVDSYDAMEAQHRMNGQIFAGREITVVLAAQTRKRPEEMRHRSRVRGGYGGGRSSYYGRPRSRSLSRSRSPRHRLSSRTRYHSRSYSPALRRQGDYSVSPGRRHADRPRSPRGPPQQEDGAHHRRSYSPGYGNGVDEIRNGNGEKSAYDSEDARAQWISPGRVPRSPSGSRSRSAS